MNVIIQKACFVKSRLFFAFPRLIRRNSSITGKGKSPGKYELLRDFSIYFNNIL